MVLGIHAQRLFSKGLATISMRQYIACTRAYFSTSHGLRSSQDSPHKADKQQSKTGVLPPYGPVGVAAALEASASTSEPLTLFIRRGTDLYDLRQFPLRPSSSTSSP